MIDVFCRHHGVVLPADVYCPLYMALVLNWLLKQFCVEVRFAVPRVIEVGWVRAVDGAVT